MTKKFNAKITSDSTPDLITYGTTLSIYLEDSYHPKWLEAIRLQIDENGKLTLKIWTDPDTDDPIHTIKFFDYEEK